jgi:hypothetical protein
LSIAPVSLPVNDSNSYALNACEIEAAAPQTGNPPTGEKLGCVLQPQPVSSKTKKLNLSIFVESARLCKARMLAAEDSGRIASRNLTY